MIKFYVTYVMDIFQGCSPKPNNVARRTNITVNEQLLDQMNRKCDWSR